MEGNSNAPCDHWRKVAARYTQPPMKVPATAACITAALLCLPQARAQGRTQQYAQCSGYYYTLSFATPEFVTDLTEQQAKQAAFAMLMKVNPDITSPEAIRVLGENWNALQAPLPRPLTQQGIDALRAGHDGSCRALLRQAWCDAYGDHGRSTCDD